MTRERLRRARSSSRRCATPSTRRASGRLYTAAYYPAEGRAEYRWPGFTWEQSLDRFAEETRHTADVHAVLNAIAPAGAGSCAGGHGVPANCAWMPSIQSQRALGQLVVVGLHARARDEHAEVGAGVAVVARAEHAQEERLGLVVQAVPVVAPAGEARCRRRRRAARCPVFGACGELLDALAVLLEDDLAPDVDARRLRPSGG